MEGGIFEWGVRFCLGIVVCDSFCEMGAGLSVEAESMF